jgi:hypothetical protein
VTREYPIIIHTIVNNEVPSSDAIVGNAIKIIFRSSDAISVPIVVFPNAIHLYERLKVTTPSLKLMGYYI